MSKSFKCKNRLFREDRQSAPALNELCEQCGGGVGLCVSVVLSSCLLVPHAKSIKPSRRPDVRSMKGETESNGGAFAKLLNGLFGKRIFMVNLNAATKTTILYKLKPGKVVTRLMRL